MALAVDATGTELNVGLVSATSQTYTGLTVGAGATQLLMMLTVSGFVPGSLTAAWDQTGTPQSMGLLGSQVSAGLIVYMFGLVNPTAGNKTLQVSWTGAASNQLGICAISFTGGQTGSVGAAFLNFASNSGTSTPGSMSATGAGGNINVAVENTSINATTISTTSSVALYTPANSNVGQAAARAPSAASITWTTNAASSATWAACCVDVAAFSPTIPRPVRSRAYVTR